MVDENVEHQDNYIVLKNMDQWHKIYNSDKCIIVDFTATWCGPCKSIAPLFTSLSRKYSDIYFVKVDVDEYDELTANSNVSCMPTFQFIKNKTLLHTLEGANRKELSQLTDIFYENNQTISKNKNDENIEHQDNYIILKNMKQWHKIYNSNKCIIVNFTATWCGPCKSIAPLVTSLSRKYSDIYFVKVDVDEYDELTGNSNVLCMPTFQFIKNKILLHTLEGANREELIRLTSIFYENNHISKENQIKQSNDLSNSDSSNESEIYLNSSSDIFSDS